MADSSGQAEIRGINIDKLAKGYADEEYILKNYCNVSSTSAREIRWYKKTAGTLDSTDTTGITGSQILSSGDQLTLPVLSENSWTRQTSYVKDFKVESPWISEDDIKDSDVDILAGNVRDLVRAVAQQVNIHIFSILVEATAAAPTTPVLTNTLKGAALGTGWNDATNGDPIKDMLSGAAAIQAYNYDTSKLVIVLHPNDHKNLMSWLISTKGSSIPSFASEKVRTGEMIEILGMRIIVTNNVTEDYAYMFIPNRTLSFKQFTPMRTALIEEKLTGTKIRIKEQGIALLTDPKSAYTITDTQT